jgi:SOS response associated peptidase (SRAP)
MCGRYRLSRRAEVLAAYDAEYESVDWDARYNIAPTQNVPVIRPLQEILRITHQHVFDQVGAVQEINVEPGSPIVEDVAILGSSLRVCLQCVRASEGDIANQETRFWTGWAEHTVTTCVSVWPEQTRPEASRYRANRPYSNGCFRNSANLPDRGAYTTSLQTLKHGAVPDAAKARHFAAPDNSVLGYGGVNVVKVVTVLRR